MLLGLFLISALSHAAVTPIDSLALASAAYRHPSIHQLTSTGRQVAAVMKNSPFKLDEKTIFLYNHPTRAIVIRATTCEAWAEAATLCAQVGQDPKATLVAHHEEEDAVRHFTLAAYLTCAQGRQVTEIFLAANEGDPEHWSASSRMDIHNNYEGIFWASDRRNCNPFGFPNRVTEAALEKLKAGELATLKKGNSRCAQAQMPQNFSLTRLGEFRTALRRLDARCGGEIVTTP